MSRACQTGTPPWHAVGSEYFEITAEIVETTTDVVEAVEQCTEFRARSGACEIEVERELEVTSGDGAALKFHEVDIQGVDAFQHAIQGARFAFERELDGRLVGTWVHGGSRAMTTNLV